MRKKIWIKHHGVIYLEITGTHNVMPSSCHFWLIFLPQFWLSSLRNDIFCVVIKPLGRSRQTRHVLFVCMWRYDIVYMFKQATSMCNGTARHKTEQSKYQMTQNSVRFTICVSNYGLQSHVVNKEFWGGFLCVG